MRSKTAIPSRKKIGTRKKKRLIEAEDLCRLRVMTSVAMSPDEKKVAYTVETVSEDKKKYYSRIHVADVLTGESQQFTFGEVNDRGLSWSPDGRSIAFISTRNKKTAIYLIPLQGGAERTLYEADGAFSGLVWTPDGKGLVFQFRYNDSHEIEDEKKKKEAPLYRHITRLFYCLDGSGFLPKDRFHLWKIDIESGKARQLTKGKYDDVSASVSPDGKWIAFISNRRPNPDRNMLRDDLYIMPAAGGQARKIEAPAGPKSAAAFSPDGKKLAFLAHTNPNDAWGVTNFHVWTVGVSGKPQARDLMPMFDRQAVDQTIGDMGEMHDGLSLYWSPDGSRIYFVATDTGNTHLFYVLSKGGRPTRVTRKKCHVKGFSLNGRKRMAAALVSDLSTPGELSLIPAVYNGDERANVITSMNRELFNKIDFPNVKYVWFKAYDGTRLQGWLVTPPGFSRNRKYPAILEIHGGPRAQYGFTFFHEMLWLASRGYVVFYTNPRGGGGQGETFAGTIIGDWGSIDYQDCMAAADYLEALPYVNKKRMGVTGGSYGGYMTNWIVGHTDRFKAAVTQRSVVDLFSFFGTSDLGYDLEREFTGFPWKASEVYERCSPLTYAQNVKTPLLIIHSERDLRCSIEQAEQLYTMLKIMNKTVEFVRFPDEPHGLSRYGRPDRRIARLEWIQKWFDRYLK